MSGEDNLLKEINEFLMSQTEIGRPWVQPNFYHLGSPIEKLLFDSVRLGMMLGVTWFKVVNCQPIDNDQLRIETQAPLLDWLVDFSFTVVSEDGVVSQLAVECDGHDFHERTKEQAARDRSRDRRLQSAGYEVYRFTGSEIYRSPLGCARQIFAWAEKAAWKKKGEA